MNNPNQHWYIDYAADGWFYICNRYSAKCLETAGASLGDEAKVHQWQQQNERHQQWRLLPLGAAIEFDRPDAPLGLSASPLSSAIRLQWQASLASDLQGYELLRASAPDGPFDAIARNLNATRFTDNSARPNVNYYYSVRSRDRSRNSSDPSAPVRGHYSPGRDLIAHLQLDGNARDSTVNAFHGAFGGTATYTAGRVDKAAALNGTDNFIQLPAAIANLDEISIAVWVYWRGGDIWQRIFDFGNGEQQNLFLTPSSDAGGMRFAINKGAGEQRLNTDALIENEWTHLAVVMNANGAGLYVNGKLAEHSSAVTIKPGDFRPVLNYLGRSQFPDPLFNGRIDDFRIYNYALSVAELAELSAP